MPLIIKDYVWKQTLYNIMVQVSLKGVQKSKADITISSRYLKILYEQNIFEIILLHPVEINASKCTVTDTHIIFDLKKETEVLWQTLEPSLTKEVKQAFKKQLLEEEYKRARKEIEEKRNKKCELKKAAVSAQIEIDTKNRQLIEDIKKKEENNAMGNINIWTNNILKKHLRTIKREIKDKTFDSEKLDTNQDTKLDANQGIGLRSNKTLQVDFTPREFPTPSRESQLEEENEWLKKQVEAQRASGFIREDIRPEERNPLFLKSKGDEFMKNSNYLGAISAYSYGIQLAPSFIDLYIARSGAHFALGNFKKTIEDCSAALDLLKPELLINLKERALCIGRRGEALCKIGFQRQGREELKASLKLMTNNYFNKVLSEAECEILNENE